MTQKVFVYARVATAEQATRSQIKECCDYAKDNGWAVKGVYSFIGSSSNQANSFERVFNKMIVSGIKKLIVIDPSRISRNPLELLKIEKEFADLGKEIVYVQKDRLNNQSF